jgi:hypothetical protein
VTRPVSRAEDRDPRDPAADPDVDGVALAAATATGVVLGTRFAVVAAWVVVALCLAVACLGAGVAPRLRDGSGAGVVVGVLVLGVLLASGAAVASVRAAAVAGAVLAGRIGHPGRVAVAATVAEEPRRLRFGGHWVVLTVHRVDLRGRSVRTRERAGVVLPRAAAAARVAAGDRLRVRGSVAAGGRGVDPGPRPAAAGQ